VGIEAASTATNTEFRSFKETTVIDVDCENKKGEEEEDYLEWRNKQLHQLNLPVFHQMAMRSFSTEKRRPRRRVIKIVDGDY